MIKINWGYRILILYVTFVAGILVLSVKAMKQNEDLVSEKYYENELNYGKQYNKMQNAINLAKDVELHYNKANADIEISFPEDINKDKISGEITFYRPDDQTLDYKIPVKANDVGKQFIPTCTMKKGQWNVIINWMGNTTPYYHEESVFISK
jgi:hypothetical protein